MQNDLVCQRVARSLRDALAAHHVSGAVARKHKRTCAAQNKPLIVSVFPAAPNLHLVLSCHSTCTLARHPTPHCRPHPPTKKNNLLQSPPPSLFISPSSVVKHSFSISLLLSLCQLIALCFCPPPPTYTYPPPPSPQRHPPLSCCQSLGALGCSLVINLHPLSAVALLGHAKQAGKQACTYTHTRTHAQVMTIQSRRQMPTFTYK